MPNLKNAYDKEAFRARGHQVVDLLAEYLADSHARKLPVLPPQSPERMLAEFPAEFPEAPQGEFKGLLERVLASSTCLHAPGFVGHQVSAPLPLAALCEFVSAFLNNGMAVYEMGPAATAMETAVVRWFCARFGLGEDSDGVLTSGGSTGNLTALLAARQAKAGFDLWKEGAAQGPPPALLVSEHAHYSMQRAARVMGWGAGGVVPVPVDARFHMRAEELPAALDRAQKAGRKVLGVVANACSTATGSFDPLEPIADFCAAHDLWFHVDAAHGGAAALSPRHRHLLKGLERADSVVCDAHKMLMMPALATLVLFRKSAAGYNAFAQEASYLFQGRRAGEEWFNIATRTLECTKRMICFKIYACLQLHGTKLFSDYVENSFELARQFAGLLRQTPGFELAVEPDANIVCFRHLPPDAKNPDDLQAEIRRRVNAGGRFYLVQTRLPKGVFLRTALMNPFTTVDDLKELLAAIAASAQAN